MPLFLPNVPQNCSLKGALLANIAINKVSTNAKADTSNAPPTLCTASLLKRIIRANMEKDIAETNKVLTGLIGSKLAIGLIARVVIGPANISNLEIRLEIKFETISIE